MDPLDIDIDITSVDTSRPVLAECLADCEIVSAIPEENSRKDGYNLVTRFRTTAQLKDIKDKDVAPGFQLTAWYPLQSKDKESGEPTQKWLENIIQLIDAALGTSLEAKDRPSLKAGIAQVVGKVVRARVTVEDMPNGLPGNSVRSLAHIK